MANIIEQVNVAGVVYNIGSTAYAVCNTAANEAAKVIQIDGIALVTGLTIHVKFNNTNSVNNPTLTITGIGGDAAANQPIPIMQYGTTNAGNQAETTSWQAGAVVSLTYDGTNWIRDQGYNTNSQNAYGNITTSGTLGTASMAVVTDANKKITTENLSVSDPPSDGNSTAFTFIDTISQNAKGKITPTKKTIPTVSSSTAGLVPKGAAVSSQTQTTKFLREDGTWAAPQYSAISHYQANLIVGNANTDKANEAVTASTTGVYLNLIENEAVRNAHQLKGAGGITIGSDASGNITFTGKAGTVTSITPGNGLINGTSGTSQTAITGSGTISIAAGGVTDAMLAGSISNDKLANKTITIGTTTKELGETFTLAELGIAQAMHFKGTTTTAMTDGRTTATVKINDADYTPEAGDVVLYSDSEFVWTGSAWERLGRDSSFLTSYTSFGKISISGVTGTDAVTANTTQLAAAGGNEAFTFKTGNKWLTAAGTNGTAGNDVLTIGHALSGVTAGNYGDSSNQTPAYGATFNVPYISVDAAGHITSISAHTVKIPASDNTDTKVTQNILAATVTDTYPLLVSAYKTSATTTTATTVNRVDAIYVQPSTGTLTATKFSGDGSGLTNVAASSVDWSNVNNKKFAALWVNATSGGAASDATATSPYIHLYDNDAKKSTIQLVGAGGTTITSNASKVITVTSTKYKSSGSANALTSLKLKYTVGTTDNDEAVSSAAASPTALGTVTNAVLYIKSMYYGTTSVSTGVTTA